MTSCLRTRQVAIKPSKWCWRILSPPPTAREWSTPRSCMAKTIFKTIKHGRFGDWLENVKDWAISRERYWGTPLPIWACDGCDHKVCVGSRDELKAQATAKPTKDLDLHRPYIDEVTLKCAKCGSKMSRVKDVIDVWFDSGAMPFAQWHYPFENTEKIEGESVSQDTHSGQAFPADYIAEAIDQTRGWFYTLLAVSTLLGRGTPYRNVVCLGHILDSKGQKMSKSKGNVVDPWAVINQYGCDALRWHLFTVNPPGEPKRFDVKNVEEVVKKIFLILWNVYTFHNNYSGGKKIAPKFGTKHVLDLWIASRTCELIEKITLHLDKYEILEAGRLQAEYIDDLSTWYLRRSRDRFKGAELKEALATLGACLNVAVKLMAPFTPFLADELYTRLGGKEESVHLEDWPEKMGEVNPQVLEDMKLVRRVCETAHALRSQAGIKVRQVLSEVVLSKELSAPLRDLIKDELNVKNVSVVPEFKASDKLLVGVVGQVQVGLNVELTDELKEEGLVREIVRGINGLRKAQNLTIQDRVSLKVSSQEKSLLDVIKKYQSEISASVLADKIELADSAGGEALEINDFTLNCEIRK
ncbi:class I tRNA ligase family protein [Candidatus Uhrbacteria bacterium]|nr:class I tRNA ligase family protein [Candidatus Uhrbacteria bacterium]